jgi:hypothetical protein
MTNKIKQTEGHAFSRANQPTTRIKGTASAVPSSSSEFDGALAPAGLLFRLAPSALVLAITIALALTATKANAQASATATGPGSFVAVGIAASGFQQDYGHHFIGGEAAYLDANLYRRIGVEVEVRRLNFHTEEDVKENTILAGFKIATNPRRFRPYIKLLAGRGTLDFPFHYATGSYFVVAPSAGLDYHLRNSRFNIRVFDFQYQLWPQFSFGQLHPYGFTTGISFDLFRPPFNPRGRTIHLK